MTNPTLTSERLNQFIHTIVNDIRLKAIESTPNSIAQRDHFKQGILELTRSINDLKYVMLEHWYEERWH